MLAHADEFFASNFHPIFKVNISITYKEIRHFTASGFRCDLNLTIVSIILAQKYGQIYLSTEIIRSKM